ncbi:MAG: Hsp33 family molecular chaperone HslO [Proteobacteria bacterium]|nr:Hsp33 family molecular chaperone HslO [Pseudomonadota bacterium]MBU1581733.1 Hsp33 family molecular chaperone HslO [Pseudomonadota bacterium]MBU2630751.1 Hsp33 family molecular chaperone HslO [Pseudomonadota bacterium]
MIKKDIFNKDIKEQFKASAKDRVFRFMMADKMIRGAVVHTTRMVNEMRANHDLGPLETLVLGQAYIAASLLSSGLKDKNDRISMSIQCSGPVKGLDVESNMFGEVRGYLKTQHIQVQDLKKVNYLSTLFGAGFLTVTRYLENAPTPYSGQIALEHGSIAEDLANYFLISEQLPTGFKLSVFFDENEEVKGAGGIFLQALPGADPAKVIEAEKIIQGMDSLGESFAKGQPPETVIQNAFLRLEPKLSDNRRVEFFCRCSKDRMQGYLKNLSKEEKKDMMENGPFPVEVICHHCNSAYCFSKEDLLKLGK